MECRGDKSNSQKASEPSQAGAESAVEEVARRVVLRGLIASLPHSTAARVPTADRTRSVTNRADKQMRIRQG